MSTKSKGIRRKTRSLFRRGIRDRTPINKLLQDFVNGSKVILLPDPSSQKGLPDRRFFGKIGTVINKRGRSYIINIKDGDKKKTVISRPEHLRPV